MSLYRPDICCLFRFVVVSSNYQYNCCCCCCCHLGSLEVTGAPMEAAHPCPHSPCWMGLQPYTSLHIASTLQIPKLNNICCVTLLAVTLLKYLKYFLHLLDDISHLTLLAVTLLKYLKCFLRNLWRDTI